MRQASSWGSGSSTRWTQTCPPARGPPSSQMSAPWTQTIVSLTIILDISTMDLDNSKLTSVISSKQKNRSNNYKLTRKIVWFGYQMIIWMDIYYYQCIIVNVLGGAGYQYQGRTSMFVCSLSQNTGPTTTTTRQHLTFMGNGGSKVQPLRLCTLQLYHSYFILLVIGH